MSQGDNMEELSEADWIVELKELEELNKIERENRKSVQGNKVSLKFNIRVMPPT